MYVLQLRDADGGVNLGRVEIRIGSLLQHQRGATVPEKMAVTLGDPGRTCRAAPGGFALPRISLARD